MNRFKNLIIMLVTLFAFAACGLFGSDDDYIDKDEVFTIEQLGAVIEASGEFWNSWWANHHTFNWDYIDSSQWLEWSPETAHHPLVNGFSPLLPSSGFVSLDDVSRYLSQFYTDTWVSRYFSEPSVAMYLPDGERVYRFGFGGFVEYGGQLYIFTMNESNPRPDWATAVHKIIEQDGNYATVETIVTTSVYGFDSDDMPTIRYTFTFVGDKIDTAIGLWQEATTGDYSHAGQGFYIHAGDYMQAFIYHANDFNADFNAILEIGHPRFDEEIAGDDIVFGATRSIYNVSLFVIGMSFDETTNEDIFYEADSFGVAEILSSEELVLITGYVSMGTFPWSGIMFDDTTGNRYFLAFNHDHSSAPNSFILLDITAQLRHREARE